MRPQLRLDSFELGDDFVTVHTKFYRNWLKIPDTAAKGVRAVMALRGVGVYRDRRDSERRPVCP